MAVEQDIVDKSGAWYAYKGDRIGQGRENAKTICVNIRNDDGSFCSCSRCVRHWYRRNGH